MKRWKKKSFRSTSPKAIGWGYLWNKEELGVLIVFPGGSDGKSLLAMQRLGFDPWVGKISWRRKWQPTLIFLPGKCHGQRSLADYSPWGRRESNMVSE